MLYPEYYDSREWRIVEKRIAYDIEERTFAYALRIVTLCRYLTTLEDPVGKTMAHQLLRSGTSIGANTAEARSAESRADYAHKLSIALKEGREYKYWIRLLAGSNIVSEPAV